MRNSHKIGLGTVQFGLNYGIANENGQTKLAEAHKILEEAKNYGIGVLDSASAYGNAEEVIGSYGLDDFNVVSKYRPASETESIKAQLGKSLKNLKKHSLYAYLAHSPKDLIHSKNEWNQLISFKKEGLVRKIGYSLNELQELEDLLHLNYIPDVVQIPYNYFDRRFESKFELLKNLGCEIHTRSAFLQGLFFIDPSALDPYFDSVKVKLENVQKNNNFSAGSLLKFVIDNHYVDRVIIGVDTVSQLKENINMLNFAEDLPELVEEIEEKILIPSLWPKK